RSMRVRRPGRREGGPRQQMPIAPVPCPVRPYSSLFSVARFRSVSDHSPTVTNPAQSPAVNLWHQEDRAGAGEGRRPLLRDLNKHWWEITSVTQSYYDTVFARAH